MGARPAAGGGRWVEVDPPRLEAWLAGFAARHGAPDVSVTDGLLALHAPDGALAQVHPPPGAPPTTDVDGFVAAAAAARRLGLLLVRRGGIAAGVADGERLVASKVDGAYVQGRTAAGGWSQGRFARRRNNQARALVDQAAAVAVRVLLAADGLDALVGGGDRRLVDAVLADRRVDALAPLRAGRFLDVPDPRLAVLQAAVRSARAIQIRIHP
jgi:VLRF1 release factor-like protein